MARAAVPQEDPQQRPRPAEAPSRPRVLLVDDDGDVRQMLAFALSRDGCQTSEACDTESALGWLRRGGFNLVITDYELPDGTGGELLRTASREHLLAGCAVLVVTGHPDPEDVGAAPVIAKPFDLEALRKQVRHIVERIPARTPSSAGKGIELVLYVAQGSPASRMAERNVRRILERARDVRFEVRDVAAYPEEAERDRILFAPTLVARCSPPVWMLGTLRNPEALLGILALCASPD